MGKIIRVTNCATCPEREHGMIGNHESIYVCKKMAGDRVTDHVNNKTIHPSCPLKDDCDNLKALRDIDGIAFIMHGMASIEHTDVSASTFKEAIAEIRRICDNMEVK